MSGGIRKVAHWATVLVGLLALACNNLNAKAQAPTANVVGHATNKSVTFAVLDVPPGEVCSTHQDLKDFCVTNLKPALSEGFKNVLAKFMTVDAANETDYAAEFRFVEFRHSPAGGNLMFPQIQVAMRWQVVLKDRAGNVLLQLAENTVGGEKLSTVYAADDVTRALLTAVMDRIGSKLAEAKLDEEAKTDDAKGATADAATTSPKTACVPGSTQACLGPGACQGAQACLSDGSGYGACDCGTPKPAP